MGGIIEIGIFAKLYNKNIIIYKDDENDTSKYKHYINIIRNENINEYIIIHYENNNHFNLLKIRNSQIKLNNY